ncbi:acyl CoA binding protein-domain-containing protein [Multifurca ochricompacta]|uniref:Acyl CoA binding protein-domain-containing protein n=1 Tax=Multifurca ochricompacta TaxID=376703 RepID=A0AAD4MDY1_9AGAM|nr:acyl CoA binding protein-domain-containing protein [Multifurca ochricompacta]
MSSHELIDTQFDRAVEIVQNLPKTSPIQTGYEEKLAMYSLYKQATAGNVRSPRPGIWDMLGRAKWDAWAKHKDLDSYEAKWLYVDALLKVLRRYSDKTVARDLVRELESYGGDPANLVHSGTFLRSPDSDSSSSEEQVTGSVYRSVQVSHHPQVDLQAQQESSTSEEETTDDEAMDLRPSEPTATINRPQSSLSSHRYRTPATSSALLSTPAVPASQPQGFETLSAFGPTPSTSLSSYPQPYAEQAVPRDATSPPSQSVYRRPPSARPHALAAAGLPHRPPSQLALERAIESVQMQLAALTERIETMESHSFSARPFASSPGPSRSSPTFPGRGSPNGARDIILWDRDEIGLWAVVFKTLARVLTSLRQFAIFLSNSEGRSPAFVVVRRLFLDLSFIFCTLALIKTVWRRTSMRRREINAAIRALWWAVVGKTPAKNMADRGI